MPHTVDLVSYSRLTSTALNPLGVADQGNVIKGLYAAEITAEEGVVFLLFSYQALAGQS